MCYDVGHKFTEKKLFVIPGCLKNNFSNSKYDLIQSLNISGYFLKKILEKQKFIFRDQFINNIMN